MRKSFGLKTLFVVILVSAVACCFYQREMITIQMDTEVAVWIGDSVNTGNRVDVYGRKAGRDFALLATNVPVANEMKLENLGLESNLIAHLDINVTPWQKHKLKDCAEYNWVVVFPASAYPRDRAAELKKLNSQLERNK